MPLPWLRGAGGYFYMADVFLTKGEVENALAFYDKVSRAVRCKIWQRVLTRALSVVVTGRGYLVQVPGQFAAPAR